MRTGQDFLSCLASYLRPGGRQDRTKIKNASCPTGQGRIGHQDRLSCAQLWCKCPSGHEESESTENIGALNNVLCLCIYLMRERGHTSMRTTTIEKKNMDYLFFVHHSSNNRKRIEFSIEIRRQNQNKTIA